MFISSLSKKEKPTKGKNVEHLPGVTIVISREGRDPKQENSRDGDHHWRASHFPQLLCQGGNCMSCANWPGQWGNGQVTAWQLESLSLIWEDTTPQIPNTPMNEKIFYNVQVSAFTKVGAGVRSHKLICTTAQDGERTVHQQTIYNYRHQYSIFPSDNCMSETVSTNLFTLFWVIVGWKYCGLLILWVANTGSIIKIGSHPRSLSPSGTIPCNGSPLSSSTARRCKSLLNQLGQCLHQDHPHRHHHPQHHLHQHRHYFLILMLILSTGSASGCKSLLNQLGHCLGQLASAGEVAHSCCTQCSCWRWRWSLRCSWVSDKRRWSWWWPSCLQNCHRSSGNYLSMF